MDGQSPRLAGRPIRGSVGTSLREALANDHMGLAVKRVVQSGYLTPSKVKVGAKRFRGKGLCLTPFEEAVWTRTTSTSSSATSRPALVGVSTPPRRD